MLLRNPAPPNPIVDLDDAWLPVFACYVIDGMEASNTPHIAVAQIIGLGEVYPCPASFSGSHVLAGEDERERFGEYRYLTNAEDSAPTMAAAFDIFLHSASVKARAVEVRTDRTVPFKETARRAKARRADLLAYWSRLLAKAGTR